MTQTATLTPPPLPMQRAKGAVRLDTARRPSGQSYAAVLRQESSFRVLFPRRPWSGVEAVLLNTAGGITGGDRFTVDANAGDGSALTLTTQAAERIYKAVGSEPGHLRTSLRAGADASLCWLPQETILFDGCALARDLQVDLAQSARFLMVEPLVFGRMASGEQVATGSLQDRISILRAGKLIYRDAINLRGAIDATLDRPALGNGAKAVASLVYAAEDAASHIDPIRNLLPNTAGASLLAEDLLVLRAVAADSFVLRQTLVPVLNHLTHNALPKTWRL